MLLDMTQDLLTLGAKLDITHDMSWEIVSQPDLCHI